MLAHHMRRQTQGLSLNTKLSKRPVHALLMVIWAGRSQIELVIKSHPITVIRTKHVELIKRQIHQACVILNNEKKFHNVNCALMVQVVWSKFSGDADKLSSYSIQVLSVCQYHEIKVMMKNNTGCHGKPYSVVVCVTMLSRSNLWLKWLSLYSASNYRKSNALVHIRHTQSYYIYFIKMVSKHVVCVATLPCSNVWPNGCPVYQFVK